MIAALDPMVAPETHRRDCGYWGACDCDAHTISSVRRVLRVALQRVVNWWTL